MTVQTTRPTSKALLLKRAAEALKSETILTMVEAVVSTNIIPEAVGAARKESDRIVVVAVVEEVREKSSAPERGVVVEPVKPSELLEEVRP